ncbi:MAG: hypothetical protein JJ913_04365 [Rhizobiaceae bacterium]|nr:hypothetical protein [Rhizobiaceae bacterium]
MVFRSAAASICAALPIRTHFFWHALNGLLLGMLAASAARHRALTERAS